MSNDEASHTEQLWDWLETAVGGPDNALAITHHYGSDRNRSLMSLGDPSC